VEFYTALGEDTLFSTLYSDKNGSLFEDERLGFLGRSGQQWIEAEERDFIPLPEGSSLVMMPGHFPVGVDSESMVSCREETPHGAAAVVMACLLPQGFTRTLLPATAAPRNTAEIPILGYTAVAGQRGEVMAAAIPTDEHRKWQLRAIEHNRTKPSPDAPYHLLETGSMIQVQGYRNPGTIGSYFDQADYVLQTCILYRPLTGLHYNRGLFLFSGHGNSLNYFHIVGVESPDRISSGFCFRQQFCHWYQCHCYPPFRLWMSDKISLLSVNACSISILPLNRDLLSVNLPWNPRNLLYQINLCYTF
jgi:hypothetical protein